MTAAASVVAPPQVRPRAPGFAAGAREHPRISIVAAARNDNHGGDLLQRMRLFVSGLLRQCERFDLPAELVLVEWNPPADRPPLGEALRWPGGGWGRCRVRVVTVPAEVHGRFEHAEALPLFQMIAKNVGIRAAAAPYVLATNIDLLFSDELMAWLARGRLRPDRMYRVDRTDVSADVPADADIAAQLQWCRDHVIRHNRREGTLDVRTGSFHRIYWDATWRVRLLEMLQNRGIVPVVTRQRLHLNACGDFTLMHRDRWLALRGYPEMAIYSMHLDSVLCTAAHFGGAKEAWLPYPVYHIEHAAGSGWSPEGQQALDDRLARAGIPQLSHDRFHRWALRMRRERRPMMFNDENWGLANQPLEEWSPAA